MIPSQSVHVVVVPETAIPQAVVLVESRRNAEVCTFYEVHYGGRAQTTSPTVHLNSKEYSYGDLGLEERPDYRRFLEAIRPKSAGWF